MSEAIQPSLTVAAAERALAEADDLVAAGAPFAAIALLTDANRVAPDVALERRLVDLRHEAFASMPTTPPTDLPEPVRATDGRAPEVTELTLDQLDVASLRAGLAQHGCVLVRRLVDQDGAAELVAGIDAAFAAYDATAEGEAGEDDAPWYHPFSPPPGSSYQLKGRKNWERASGAVWTADSPRMLFRYLDLLGRLGIGDLVSDYLGERPALSVNKCALRRVPATGLGAWHQDGSFLGSHVRTLNVWLALSSCGVDAPGLEVLPRRLDEVVATGTEGAIFDWDVSPAVVAEVAGPVATVVPAFEPGDALLFDHLFLHRTATGPHMTRERHAIETWFFAPSAYPDGYIPFAY